MYNIKSSNQFEKDYKKIKKSGQKDMQLIKNIIQRLANGEKLEPKYRDHLLIGNYKGRRECHLMPDWLLIYYIDDDTIFFERTGTHSELFNK